MSCSVRPSNYASKKSFIIKRCKRHFTCPDTKMPDEMRFVSKTLVTRDLTKLWSKY